MPWDKPRCLPERPCPPRRLSPQCGFRPCAYSLAFALDIATEARANGKMR
jgi:hypothetical protein